VCFIAIFLHLSQKVVEPCSEIYTFLQLPYNIDKTIAINGDFNSHFSALLFYYPIRGLTNSDFDSNFLAPLFYKTIGGSTGASDEIFYAPIFEGLTLALNNIALQFHAEFINRKVSTFPPIFSKIGEVQPKVDFQRKVDFVQAVLSHPKSASWSMRRKSKNRNLLIIYYFYKTKVNKSIWVVFLYLKL
jgi:hypothetical protein